MRTTEQMDESLETLGEEVNYYLDMRGDVRDYVELCDRDKYTLYAEQYLTEVGVFYEGLSLVTDMRGIDFNGPEYEDLYSNYVASYFNFIDELLYVLYMYKNNGGLLQEIDLIDIIQELDVNDIIFIVNKNIDVITEKSLVSDTTLLLVNMVIRKLEHNAEVYDESEESGQDTIDE